MQAHRAIGARELKAAFCLAAVIAASPASATCFSEASREYGVREDLLRAVAKVESSGRVDAVNFNARSKTEDLGLMQINSRWLSDPRLVTRGITRDRLLKDSCLNLKVGAWVLQDSLTRTGDNWNGVGAYNAGCKRLSSRECASLRARYAWKVFKALPNFGVQASSGIEPALAKPALQPEAPVSKILTTSFE